MDKLWTLYVIVSVTLIYYTVSHTLHLYYKSTPKLYVTSIFLTSDPNKWDISAIDIHQTENSCIHIRIHSQKEAQL